MLPPFSVVIPIYNELPGLEKTVRSVLSAVTKCSTSWEIILIDDGSNDGSTQIVQRLAKLPNIRALYHDHNWGYGATLKVGCRLAKYSTVVIIDADDSYPSHQIGRLVENMNAYDMVVGARLGWKAKIPMIRRPAKWVLNQLANFLCGYRIADLNSGFRAMNRSVVMRYLRILPNGFSFTSTITLAMLTNGFRVRYIPIPYATRLGRSKIRPVRDVLNFVRLILRTVMYFNPLRIFFPITVLVLALATATISFDISQGNLSDKSTILILTGIITLALGLLADLIVKRLSLSQDTPIGFPQSPEQPFIQKQPQSEKAQIITKPSADLLDEENESSSDHPELDSPLFKKDTAVKSPTHPSSHR